MVGPEADAPSISEQTTTDGDAESHLLDVQLRDDEFNTQDHRNAQDENVLCDWPSVTAAESTLLPPLESTDSLERTDSDLSLLEPIAGHRQPYPYPRSRSASHSRTNLPASNGIRSSSHSPGRVQKPRYRLHAPPAAPPSAVSRSRRDVG